MYRLVREYPQITAIATGDSASVSQPSAADIATKSAALPRVNAHAAPTLICPDGISRVAVRGLRASKSRSTSRLKPIALDRAVTMQPTISAICHTVGGCTDAASTAAASANGSAKMLWESLIIRP